MRGGGGIPGIIDVVSLEEISLHYCSDTQANA